MLTREKQWTMEDSNNINAFTDVFETAFTQQSPPMSLSQSPRARSPELPAPLRVRPAKGTGQMEQFRSVQEIDPKYRDVFSYPYFNLIQSRIIDDALYSNKSIVVCAPTGSGKTVVFEMAIVQLLMELEDQKYTGDFKIVYMAPVKALCTERLSEWYPKFTRLGHLCIEVTGDTDVDFVQLKQYKIIITTPEKWDMLTRRWREFRSMVEVVKLFLIDEVHILHDEARGPVLEAVVSRMKTIEDSMQATHRIEQAQLKARNPEDTSLDGNANCSTPRIRFVAVSATVSNPDDVATWLGTPDNPAVYYKMGEECRPVRLRRVVEGYHCPDGANMFKFDLMLSYKLWPIIEKYYNGKPTLIFCNTRKSVTMTAETLSRELTIQFSPEQRAKLSALAATIWDKKLQVLVLNGVGCHHAGLLYEERLNIELAFRQRDLPVLVTTTTLAMGVNLPAHLVIIKCTQQYINGQYQEYSVSTVLQMMGRAGRPQFDTEATAVIMTRLQDKESDANEEAEEAEFLEQQEGAEEEETHNESLYEVMIDEPGPPRKRGRRLQAEADSVMQARYCSLVEGSGPLESSLHRRLAEHLNSEVALGTVQDVAQGVQWARSTFLHVRAARDPRRYLNLPSAPAPPSPHLISQRIQDMCMKAMNGLASAGLISMDEACCVSSTPAGRLMSLYCLDFGTMKLIMKISGGESLQQLLWLMCESHELAGLQLRMDERRTLNALNRNNAAPATAVRFPVKGKIATKQMKFYCVIQAVFGCLHIPDPSLHQEATKLLRTADRICKCMVAYITREDFIKDCPPFFEATLSAITLASCCSAQLWPDSPYLSRQLRGIGPALSTALASAGKTNFRLIEESHPRDLERIMNKGPPTGNVVRKQVSLLPKYQLSVEQVDSSAIDIAVVLLNAAHMADNIDHLTAGDSHRTYVVAGDSENCVLLCASFKDKDLISGWNSTIRYSVKTRQVFEHTIHVHCISSSFVGLDVKESITIPGLDTEVTTVDTDLVPQPVEYATSMSYDARPTKRNPKKQTMITDTFKERKRKINVCDISQESTSKMKKFKEPFGIETNAVKAQLDKSRKSSHNKAFEEPSLHGSSLMTTDETYKNSTLSEEDKRKETLIEDFSTAELDQLVHNMETSNLNVVDNQDLNVDGLLNEIEREMETTEQFESIPHKNSECSPKYLPTATILDCDKKHISSIKENVALEKCENDHIKYIGAKRQLTQNAQSLNKDLGNWQYNKYKDLIYNEDTSSDEDPISKQDGFNDNIKTNLHKYLQNEHCKNKARNEYETNLRSFLLSSSYCHKKDKNYEHGDEVMSHDTEIFEHPKKDFNDKVALDKNLEPSTEENVAPSEAADAVSNPIFVFKSMGPNPEITTHEPNKTIVSSEINVTTLSNQQDLSDTHATENNSIYSLDYFGEELLSMEEIEITPQNEDIKPKLPVINVQKRCERNDVVEVLDPHEKVKISDMENASKISNDSSIVEHISDNAVLPEKQQSRNACNPNQLNSYLAAIQPHSYKASYNHASAIRSTEIINQITGFIKERIHGNPKITLEKTSTDLQVSEKQPNDTSNNKKNTPTKEYAKPFKYKHICKSPNFVPVMSLKQSVTRENTSGTICNNADTVSQDTIPQEKIEIIESLNVHLQVKTTITESRIDIKKSGFMNHESHTKIFSNIKKCNPSNLKPEFKTASVMLLESLPSNVDTNNESCINDSAISDSISGNNVKFNMKNMNAETITAGIGKSVQLLLMTDNDKAENKTPHVVGGTNVTDVNPKKLELLLLKSTVENENKAQIRGNKAIQDVFIQRDNDKPQKSSGIENTNSLPPKSMNECRSTESTQGSKKELEQSQKNVPSILHKYRSILRRPEKTDPCKPIESKHSNSTQEIQQDKKCEKKLFKIQEIDNIHLKIPQLTNVDEGVQIDTLNILNSYKITMEARNQFSEYNENIGDLELVDDISNSYVLSSYSQETNQFIDSLQQIEINYSDLDKNMFNPKCLLVSCQNNMDNSILPPPPDFCNNDNVRQACLFDQQTCFSDQSEQSTGISVRDTRECTETWTFNTDECLNQSVSKAFQPFSVVRNNQAKRESYSVNKLHQFKFTGKEKLKTHRRHTYVTPYMRGKTNE